MERKGRKNKNGGQCPWQVKYNEIINEKYL